MAAAAARVTRRAHDGENHCKGLAYASEDREDVATDAGAAEAHRAAELGELGVVVGSTSMRALLDGAVERLCAVGTAQRGQLSGSLIGR